MANNCRSKAKRIALSAIAPKSLYIKNCEKAFQKGIISEDQLVREYEYIISVRGVIKSVAHKIGFDKKQYLSSDDEDIII